MNPYNSIPTYVMTKQLTLKYINAFDAKDIDKVLNLCSDDIYLKDPENEIFNKTDLKNFLTNFFKNDISFTASKIICEQNTSVIHFKLSINGEMLKGVDIIDWQDQKIRSLVAYL